MSEVPRCPTCGIPACRIKAHVPMTEPKWVADYVAAQRARKLNAAGSGVPTTGEGTPSRDPKKAV